jgi:hypothetical protein
MAGVVVAILTGVALGAGSASAQDARDAVSRLADQIIRVLPESGQVRIVVTDFDDAVGVTSDYGRYLTDLLIVQLGRTPRLLPIERRHLQVVLGQLDLRSADLRKPDNARRVASQFGASIVLVDGLADLGAQVALDARVIDLGTGETLGFASAGVVKDAKVQRMLDAGRR